MKLSFTGIVTLFFLSCHPPVKKEIKRESGNISFPYSWDQKSNYEMPKDLDEISGITILSQRPNTIFAIQDEKGILFAYDLVHQKLIDKRPFAGDGDYEDVTSNGVFFFVLRSDGVVYSFPTTTEDPKKNVLQQKKLLPKGEYESMSYDSATNQIYVLCKECKVDRKNETVTGYIFKIQDDGQLVRDSTFKIKISALRKLDDSLSKTFKPSAMARHLRNNEWYVLSSIDRSLVVLNNDFEPIKLQRFDRSVFQQPEGMVFDHSYNLYIATEAGGQKNGWIFKIQER